jgi:hypothetical protein
MDKEAFKKLQSELPWTNLWSEDHRNDPRSYKDFEHCLINIVAFAGDILRRIERADHYGADYVQAIDKDKDGEALAYIVMSAMRAANVHPQGLIDLSAIMESDIRRRS